MSCCGCFSKPKVKGGRLVIFAYRWTSGAVVGDRLLTVRVLIRRADDRDKASDGAAEFVDAESTGDSDFRSAAEGLCPVPWLWFFHRADAMKQDKSEYGLHVEGVILFSPCRELVRSKFDWLPAREPSQWVSATQAFWLVSRSSDCDGWSVTAGVC